LSSVKPNIRWVIAGGGSGGHVTPAIALAEMTRSRGEEVLLLGAQRGMETRLVPEAGFELLALSANPVYGKSLLARLRSFPSMARACWSAWRALGSFGADYVISVGGYASVPAVIGAVVRRIPIALVEPNAIAGRANRAAARSASQIFVNFERAKASFEQAGHDCVQRVGIPLRASLVQAFASDTARRVPKSPFRLFITGGSQGARQLNEAMIEAAPLLRASPFEIEVIHQTGPADRDRTEAAYRDAGVDAQVVAFESDMPARYRWADIVLCRAGAITIAELSLSGMPALLVPYPFAADNHQAANAAEFSQAGAGLILDEQPLPGKRVIDALTQLFEQPKKLAEMSRRASKLAQRDAASVILADCAGRLGA
jgi:UDP-N-acetylglucosamine--N-acetylmuramyl-(pentapeptide) pyrophosphoryl-undecaprenol N-acetylglucosamine transferase